MRSHYHHRYRCRSLLGHSLSISLAVFCLLALSHCCSLSLPLAHPFSHSVCCCLSFLMATDQVFPQLCWPLAALFLFCASPQFREQFSASTSHFPSIPWKIFLNYPRQEFVFQQKWELVITWSKDKKIFFIKILNNQTHQNLEFKWKIIINEKCDQSNNLIIYSV